MKKISIISIILIVILLLSCGVTSTTSPSTTTTKSSTSISWEKAFENKLNKEFTGTGIVSFKIDYSLIYVEVDNSVSTSEYGTIARAWALKLSKEKQKHSGSNITSYIIKNGKICATIDYNKSKGFH